MEPKFPRIFPGQELFTLQPSLGLLALGASLEKEGFNVEIADMNVENDLDINSCFAVGITGHPVQHKEIVKIAKKIKAQNPDMPVILGGPHATFCTESILKQIKEIDFIIRNEADFSLPLLLKNIDKPGMFGKIPGLAFRKGSKIMMNSTEMVCDINKLPVPAFHLLKLEKHFKKLDEVSAEFGLSNLTMSLGLCASRGCPASCTFCTARLMLSPKWRVKKPERVIKELKQVQKTFKPWLNRLEIDFVDNTFNASKEWLIKFCKLKIKEKIGIKWRCFCRANIVDEESARWMAKAGCIGVFIGAETANDKSLQMMKKGIVTGLVDKAVDIFVKNEIPVIVSFMVGFHWETKKEVMQTLRTALAFQEISPLIESKVFKPTPFEGTELWNILKKEGLLKQDKRILKNEVIDAFDISRRKGLTFNHPFLSEKELDAMIVWFNLKTAITNLNFMIKQKDIAESLNVRLKLLIGITKTLGSKNIFENEIRKIETLIEKPEKSEIQILDKRLDLAIKQIINKILWR